MCFCVCRSVEYLQNACCEGAANKDSDSDDLIFFKPRKETRKRGGELGVVG